MPADIRSFFGGGQGAAKPKAAPAKKEEKPKPAARGSKARKVVEDSDDDVEEVKKPAKKAAPKKPVKAEPKEEEIAASDYFASSRKKAAAPSKAQSTPVKKESTPLKKEKASPVKKEVATRASPRSQRKTTSYKQEADEDSDAFVPPKDDSDGDDIFAADVKTGGRRKDDDYMEIDSDDDIKPKKPARGSAKGKAATPVVLSDDDELMDIVPQAKKRAPPAAAKKRKSVAAELDDDESDAKPKKPAPKKPRAAPKKKGEEPTESAEMQAALDSVPLIEPPKPPPKDENAPKFDFRKAQPGGGNAGPPPAAGSKEIPEGADNCLAGLTFVFTGLLDTISRDEGQELVKRYGGKVTGAPSRKTSYVVLGNEAGPSKLRKIEELGIKTINEDGLFYLIKKTSEVMTGGGTSTVAAQKALEKRKLEEEKMKQQAEEDEREEKRKQKAAEVAAKKAAEARGLAAPVKKDLSKSQLWTVKYAPSSMNQICGNKGQVEKIQAWLQAWPKNHRTKFQMPGKNGSGTYRAIIIHGPPGIGKTTAAHLACKLEGFDVIESNASDTRSKKMVELGLNDVMNNRSLLGYFAGDAKEVDVKKKKIVLIMDEVDGMSAGDRGGVGALAKLCKKTDVPMILICNDRKLPKMKPFDFVTYDVPFRRPTVDQVRSRVATICHREGLKLSKEAMDALIEGSNKDIRQIVNMLSSAKLDQDVMDFDKTKSMSKQWEKHIVLKPWDICHKLLGGGLFAPSSKATLNDKIELYFNDHEFSYLMLQENYLSTRPMLAQGKGYSPREERLKVLELVDKAAESISDGDLVDRMIHGSQQQWSLMPTHAVFSTVRPASFISGAMTGQTAFTSWLGNNSKQGKLSRYVKEIQSHMRLRTSGDRHEIRQQYLPVLWTELVDRLQNEGKEAVDDVIDLMDSYFLTREDFDAIMELGLGPQRMENVKLDTQTKATFTRLYNQRSHPMPFMQATGAAPTAKAPKVVPDLEEAIEESDDEAVLIDPAKEEDDDEVDLSKDKYIKKPKKKAAPKKEAAPKAPKKPAKKAAKK